MRSALSSARGWGGLGTDPSVKQSTWTSTPGVANTLPNWIPSPIRSAATGLGGFLSDLGNPTQQAPDNPTSGSGAPKNIFGSAANQAGQWLGDLGHLMMQKAFAEGGGVEEFAKGGHHTSSWFGGSKRTPQGPTSINIGKHF